MRDFGLSILDNNESTFLSNNNTLNIIPDAGIKYMMFLIIIIMEKS